MEKMNDLKALLQHEVQDLISAEEQIIAAMPAMIERAQDENLKKALQAHLTITENQRARLDEVQKAFGSEEGEDKGFLAGLLDAIGGQQTCRGMEGIIAEGQKILKAPMSPEVMDAAIIACSQKIEHYEICGYGTAKAYATQLELEDVARLLEETLKEEYEADDILTRLALGEVNEKAEQPGNGQAPAKKAAAKKQAVPAKKTAAKKAPVKAEAPNKQPAKKAAAKKASPKKAAPPKKAAAKKETPKKAAPKKGR